MTDPLIGLIADIGLTAVRKAKEALGITPRAPAEIEILRLPGCDLGAKGYVDTYHGIDTAE